MKFNEKLIELRKKQGLSQEELGYKLNVTRQTVSKWELGQTTPEMDKLIEIGKTFNVSVDELINETETTSTQDTVIEDKTIVNENHKEKTVKGIIIALIIALVIIIVFKAFAGFNIFNVGLGIFENAKETSSSVEEKKEGILDKFFGLFDRFFNLFDKALDSQQNINEKKDETFDKFVDMYNKTLETQQNMLDNGTSSSMEEKTEEVFDKFFDMYDKALNDQQNMINDLYTDL